MNAAALYALACRVARFVFVAHFSDLLSVVAVGISSAVLWRDLSAGRPRLVLCFELRDARLGPRDRLALGALFVSNIGRCAFTVRRAGLLLVSGAFAPNAGGDPCPLFLRPGDCAEIPVAVDVDRLASRAVVAAVELGDGRTFAARPFVFGVGEFVRLFPTERARLLDRRRIFPRRLRREVVKNAHEKREQRKH